MKKTLLPIVLALFACNVFGESKEIAEFRKRAAAGDVVAQYVLGEAYYFGDAVPQDYKDSAKWYRKVAVQGFVNAQC